MPKIACRWCQDKLDLEAKPGWHTCQCETILVNISNGYYRVIANFEDFIDISNEKHD